MASADLNLLVVFDALARDLSTTKAAQKLNLSQPAISHALNRLRKLLDDPLFVRSSRGLVATERALELTEPVRDLLSRAELILAETPKFDPKKENRTFRISTTDYFEQIALPLLISRLEKEAPNVQIVTRPASPRFPKEELESGQFDLAIAGFYGELPEGFFQQTVYKDDFVCVGRRGNNSLIKNMTLKKYASARHILISPNGDMKPRSAAILKKHGHVLRYAAGTFSFLSPGWIVAESDLLLTCPRKLANSYKRHLPLEIAELPFEIPPITVVQVWHAKNRKNVAHEWLRKVIKEITEQIE